MKKTRKIEASFFRNLMRELAIFVVGVAILVTFWPNVWLTTLLIVGLTLTRAYFWSKPGDLALYCVGGFLGTTAEAVAVAFGVWSYAAPSFFGIPIWLPFAWGLTTILMFRMAEGFGRIKD